MHVYDQGRWEENVSENETEARAHERGSETKSTNGDRIEGKYTCANGMVNVQQSATTCGPIGGLREHDRQRGMLVQPRKEMVVVSIDARAKEHRDGTASTCSKAIMQTAGVCWESHGFSSTSWALAQCRSRDSRLERSLANGYRSGKIRPSMPYIRLGTWVPGADGGR